MEIITGVERRRRWRVEDKLRIVAETEQPDACFAEIARRHEVLARIADHPASRLHELLPWHWPPRGEDRSLAA